MTTYQQFQQELQLSGQAALRTAILDAATHLLVSQGLSALTMRRVAGEVGASTKVLYTMFGGKEGLIEALGQEGFDRFARKLESVPPADDPIEYLIAIGRAYRAYALAEPDYYRVIFGGALPGHTSDPQGHRENVTFAAFAAYIDASMKAGLFEEGDPVEVAELLWAVLHGVVSLEIAGHFHDGERRIATLLTALGTSYLRKDPS